MEKKFMNKQYWLLLLLAILAGFFGGAVASWLFAGQPVFAEKKTKPAKVIEAEEFRLIDETGKIRGKLRMSYRKPILELLDGEGKQTAWIADYSVGVVTKTGDAIVISSHDVPTLQVWDEKLEGPRIELGLGFIDKEPHLAISGKNNESTRLRPARLDLDDKNGSVTLGATSLKNSRTGIVEKRPACSLILFNKDSKVIWSVP